MLSDNELGKLFALLEHTHGNKKINRDKETILAWKEVLSPWSYDQVRRAAIARSRQNRFLPDPSELAAFCPRDQESAPPSGWAGWCELLKRRRELKEKRRLSGLPADLKEARGRGIAAVEWHMMLERAGLGVEEIL